jgi:hypothetical protein
MSKLSYGEVEVEVGAYDSELEGYETITLSPTLRSYEQIEKRYGGLGGALQPLGSFNIESILVVFAAGANITGKDNLKELKQKIFDRGVNHCSAQAVKFVTLLMNPTARDDDEEPPAPGK